MANMYIDFHAHVIPDTDHGSDSLDTSLAQLEKARAAGVGTIVATPHFYLQDNSVDTFLARRNLGYNKLIDAAGDSIKIIRAAEVALSFDLPAVKDLEKLCIEGTNYILLEMPMQNRTHWVLDAIYKITSRNAVRPIIAHIDRYDLSLMDDLIGLDVLFQVNASALVPVFKRGTYLKLVHNGLIHVLGSDVHCSALEYDDFTKAVKVLGKDMKKIILNAEAILRGEHI